MLISSAADCLGDFHTPAQAIWLVSRVSTVILTHEALRAQGSTDGYIWITEQECAAVNSPCHDRIWNRIRLLDLRIKCAEINQMETASSPFGAQIKNSSISFRRFLVLLVAKRCETPLFVSARNMFLCKHKLHLNTLSCSRREKSKTASIE